MRASVRLALIVTAVTVLVTGPLSAQTYVGSWRVDAGPNWISVPLQYSALDAAALLFGGLPSDYVISTVDNNPLNIDFMGWYSVWGQGPDGSPICGGAFPCGSTLAQGFTNGTNYATYGDVSAYVDDWAVGAQYTNYAFRQDVVPEPATMTLLATGLAGMAAARRRRKKA